MVVVMLVVPIAASAQSATSTLPDPGTLPDSPLYFLKSWKEGVQLFFTFGAEKKAEQYLHLAEVRLAEYEKMIEKALRSTQGESAGQTQAKYEKIAERTLEKYENQLERALTKAQELRERGEDVANDLIVQAKGVAIKNLAVLERNLEKVPDSAKEGIERALEASRKRFFLYFGEGDDIEEVDDDEDISAVPAGWQTYRNAQYGFEVRLPLTYELRLASEGKSLTFRSERYQFQRSDGGFETPALKIEYNPLVDIAKFWNVSFVESSKFEERFRDVNRSEINIVFSAPNGKKIYASCVYGEPIETCNGILSTFKFISPDSGKGTSNLKDFGGLIDDKGLKNELDDLLKGLE